jgi:hypothetical protein
MSINSLYIAFTQAAAAGEISATILPLMGKLAAVLGIDSLLLTQGDAEQLPTAARLTGATTWAQGTAWSLELVGTVDGNGRDNLVLTLSALAARGFVSLETLVPDLPQSRVTSANAPGAVTLGDSVLAALGPEQASVSVTAVDDDSVPAERPELGGWLMLTDTSLSPYISLMGASQLVLTGRIDPRAEANIALKIDLDANAPSLNGNWDKIPMDGVALKLTTATPDTYSLDTPQPLISSVLLKLSLSIDTGEPKVVTVTVPLLQTDNIWDIAGQIAPPLTLSDGIAALMALFPGAGASTFVLPPGVAALDAFGLSGLRYGVKTTGSPPLPSETLYTGATIVSTTPWDPPIPFVLIEKVGANWLVRWQGKTTNWSAVLFGTMRFGAKTANGTDPAVIANAPTDDQGNPIYLDVTCTLPGLDIEAETRGVFSLGISEAMKVFFPDSDPAVGGDLVVDAITMSASIPLKTYGATLKAHGTWAIPIGNVTFTLDEVSFEVTVSPNQIWGGLAGVVGVSVSGETKAQLSAGAYYPGDGSWLFQGGLAVGSLNLTELASAFLGQTPPTWLPNLELTRLWAEYSTGTGNPYSVSAAVAVRWDPEVLGLKLSLTAEADITYRAKATETNALAGRDILLLKSLATHRPELHTTAMAGVTAGNAPAMIYEGTVKGTFELNNLLVTVGFSFIADELTWLFGLQLDRFSLEARTSWTGEGAKRHQVLTVQMKGVTLGAMIESFAALANPNANYRLESPWTFLNSIDLGSFTLVLDPTEQSVTLNYAINLNLAFINIKTVGIRYARSTGEPQVDIEITGTFLGQGYGREPGMTPLAWDALNDSPPAIPGEGNQLITLRYLGFGQHVSLDGLTRPDSLAEIVKLMRAQLQPMDDSMRNPLDQPSGNQLHFDESSQWLIGLDVTVMGTVTVKLAMHDPDLYGILIALAGPEAGTLAGFSFELLYKKVTDDIGVFHARLQVPDMFRQLDFGAVSITLGIITVDIFTNGNFKVDLGFPHARDFSISFGLSYGPFLGKGGIYFGYLNGDTSTSVPAITNGTFSPVLELGLGLAVGVGREFNKGPLKAGAYIQVEVVFEGVLAWFHPDDASGSKAIYYWARGSAALVGKVYGEVDFKIISVDISFEAYAAATLTLAAYRPTQIEMSVGVKVHASVKIVFVRIHFSFSTSLDISFTIGSASTTPWVLSADQSGRSLSAPAATTTGALKNYAALGAIPHANASRSIRPRRRRRPADMARITRQQTLARLDTLHARGLHHPLSAQIAMFVDAEGDAADACTQGVYRLNFSPDAKVYADGAVEPLDVRIVPGFTIAEMPISWPGGTQTEENGAPTAYRVIAMLSIDGPAPAQCETLEAVRRGKFVPTTRAQDQAETPFALLAEGLFRWCVTAIGLDPQSATLTAGDLAELAAQMDCPPTFAVGFKFDNLSRFLGNNVSIHLSGIPSGGTPDTISGVSFPMPPVLGWSSPDLPPPENARDFATYQPVDEQYAARITAYFSKLSPQPAGNGGTKMGGIENQEPLASVVFREYALLVAKSMVQAAQNLFARFPYDIDETTKLSDVATAFPTVTVDYVMHLGDTLEQVAETYGYGAAELLALNPDLEAELQAAVPGTLIAVVLGVTPESVAAANPERLLTKDKIITAATLETQILSGEQANALCARVGANATQWLGTAAALDVAITRATAVLDVPQVSYPNPSGLTLTQTAALLYVRLHEGTPAVALIPETAWYAEAITGLTGQDIGADCSLPATVKLPSAYNVLTDPVDWTRLTGDTLALLAAVTSLWQNPDADAGFTTWLAAVEAANPGYSGGAVVIPVAATALLPVETLRALAARLLLVTDPTADTATPSAAFTTLVAPADILAPLASVVVTDCRLTTGSDQSLRDFSTLYDLSIETVGRIGAEVPGLIAPVQDQPLIVPSLAAVTLSTLMPKLTADAPVRDVAGQVSRFMLQGQRLPVPTSQDDVLGGLYELLGQQVTGPAPDPQQPPETVQLSFTFSQTVATSWITFVNTEVAGVDATPEALGVRGADFAARNPAVTAGRLRPGMILETADAATLTVPVTEAMLNAGYPSTKLTPVLWQTPQALPLWQDVPVRHGLPQRVLWQTAVRPNLPVLGDSSSAPALGMPSLWPFTTSLSAIAAAADDKPWQLYRTDPELGPDAKAIAMERFAWATTIDIRLNRIPGRPHTAEVIGADTAGRQLLLELWQYLENAGANDTADLFFGFQLSPATGLAGGLATSASNPDDSYLVRTNLTTETRSGNLSSRRTLAMGEGDTPPSGPYFAPMSNALGFLTLLWEASVVGGGGYWLNYTDTNGNSFDEAMWGQEGGAVLMLVAVLESQVAASPERRLYRFNNAALVGEPVDTSSNALFVAAPDDRDMRRLATVAPGNVGFTMGITNPAVTDEGSDVMARRLYSLAGYQLADTVAFEASSDGRPVTAQVGSGDGLQAMRMAPKPLSEDNVNDDQQTIAQVIPIHRYAKTANVPNVPGLPPADDDPYAGLSSVDEAPPTATVTLGFHDIYGNGTASEPTPTDQAVTKGTRP